MALSRRVDLTETGDFQKRGREFIRERPLTVEPFTDLIPTLYNRRNERVREERENRISFELNTRAWQLEPLDDEDLMRLMSRAVGVEFPWSFKSVSWISHNEDEIFLTGDRDIIKHKKRNAHYVDGTFCECCGANGARKPWFIEYGLCIACEEYFEDGKREEVNGERNPFTRTARDLMDRLKRRVHTNNFNLNHSNSTTVLHRVDLTNAEWS